MLSTEEKLTREESQHRASLEVDEEQKRRLSESNLDEVRTELRRKASQKQAALDVDHEQDRRVTEDKAFDVREVG